LFTNLEKHSVERVPLSEVDHAGFYSTQFTVPKGDSGKHRQVSNLRPLNQFIQPRHFKMESLKSLPSLLREGDWMTSLDIRDAFFHIPLHPDQKDLFRFRWDGEVYRFRAMPFGLSSAPRVFTKVMKPVVGFLRSRGVRCIIYLDDLLLIARSPEESREHTQMALDLLHNLGFSISWEKSQLEPLTEAEFLGFTIDSRSMEIKVPAKKIADIRKGINRILSGAQTDDLFSPRQLASLVGKLHSTYPGFDHAPLLVRETRACYLASMRRWDTPCVRLSPSAVTELQEWLEALQRWNGRHIIPRKIDLVLTSDASRSGWGGFIHLPSQTTPLHETWGFWSPAESARSSNWREATATNLTLRALAPHLIDRAVLIQTDNQSNVSALAKKGSSILPLSRIAKDTLQFCQENRIQITVQHVPGLLNTRADSLSRVKKDSTDWKLHPDLYLRVAAIWGTPSVDLFATRTNRQTTRFFSYRPDPEAAGLDAFLQSWSQEKLPYANPPFSVMGKVLEKVSAEKLHRLILVAPIWKTAPWWPVLLQRLVDHPLLFPRTVTTYLPGHLGSETGIGQPTWASAAFLLSGEEAAPMEFQKKLSSSWNEPSETQQARRMTDIGPASSNTWMDLLRFRPL